MSSRMIFLQGFLLLLILIKSQLNLTWNSLQIETAELPTDHKTKKRRGFIFITFKEASSVKKCLEKKFHNIQGSRVWILFLLPVHMTSTIRPCSPCIHLHNLYHAFLLIVFVSFNLASSLLLNSDLFIYSPPPHILFSASWRSPSQRRCTSSSSTVGDAEAATGVEEADPVEVSRAFIFFQPFSRPTF